MEYFSFDICFFMGGGGLIIHKCQISYININALHIYRFRMKIFSRPEKKSENPFNLPFFKHSYFQTFGVHENILRMVKQNTCKTKLIQGVTFLMHLS